MSNTSAVFFFFFCCLRHFTRDQNIPLHVYLCSEAAGDGIRLDKHIDFFFNRDAADFTVHWGLACLQTYFFYILLLLLLMSMCWQHTLCSSVSLYLSPVVVKLRRPGGTANRCVESGLKQDHEDVFM